MKKILVLNASPRQERSHSRRLTDVFVEYYKECKPEASIKFRDLGKSNIPHVDEKWIAGAFKPQEDRTPEEIEALRFSTELIAELKDADVIVLGTPMYNWSVPSSLKAYIDQVLRVNETWIVNREDMKNPYIGLLKNKSLVLLLSRGAQGYEKGEYNEHMNFQSPYLRTVFNIIGVTDIQEVSVDGEAFGTEAFEAAVKKSNAKVKELIQTHLS
ncbi:FMN-dependent NADH-azoreductase [Flavobacterium sp. N1736]|uniref:FMN-dependent NADH-azoreductase n=1 Tax=Flavobacterium sp. N1736 TaxID=2986823 RepID=UPI0022248993|nr:NAD(P)H-dependent oxidoreductase [Flavobacterium sp. N1736]